MNDEKIIVSVLCLAYNHEKYIEQCLDGIVNQKTTFKYEVLIHDDASTDKTASIIRKYEKMFPALIHSIYQTENQYSQRKSITARYMLPRVQGKYIAICEGDDYWCDENKLQMQVDALEAYSDCHICIHRVRGISEDNQHLIRLYPIKDIPKMIFESELFLQEIMKYSFQTSSYMLDTNIYKEYFANYPDFKKAVPFLGDTPILLYFCSKGKAYYINQIMSCYRMLSIGSWNSKMKNSTNEKKAEHKANMAKMYLKYDEFTNYQFHKLIERQIRIYEYEKELILGNYYKILSLKYIKFINRESFRGMLNILAKGIYQKIKMLLIKNNVA